MLKVLKSNKFVFLLLFFFFGKEAKAESVKFLVASEERPVTLFLFPGRVSLLSLPCPITKALTGSPNDIKAEVDDLSPKDAHILLKKWKSQPSNLILKCSERVFLFNILPTKKSHYDYVRVLSHRETSTPLKLKSPLPNTPSLPDGGLREGKDFKIRKILDFSWEDKK